MKENAISLQNNEALEVLRSSKKAAVRAAQEANTTTSKVKDVNNDLMSVLLEKDVQVENLKLEVEALNKSVTRKHDINKDLYDQVDTLQESLHTSVSLGQDTEAICESLQNQVQSLTDDKQMCEQQARIIQKQHDDHIEMITTEARTGHFRFDPNTHTSITMQDLVSNVQRSQAFARDSTHQASVSPFSYHTLDRPPMRCTSTNIL